MDSEQGATLAEELSGRYRIERVLGRGGMAVVYLAHDLKQARQVALKVMNPDLVSAHGHERFLREIAIAARLNHPHIVPLFDSGIADGQPYYIMPYVDGESLRTRLARERRLALDEAVRLAREIASGLGHAHRAGLVHRDIKPENVLLADGLARVADFGIARAVPGHADPSGTQATTRTAFTAAGSIVGTPAYMSPEQVSGDEVDARSDLYALACVLFEMLAGRPPFVATTTAAILRMHLAADAPSVLDFRPETPPALASALARALAKPPLERFASAAQFSEALLQASSSPPGPSSSRPHAEVAAIPNNLPHPRTRFIGRVRELEECVRLLGDARLLTITGIGGCGKTRLALKLARTCLGGYPDGAWFVDLAPLRDADHVGLAAAAAMGVAPAPGVRVIETLIETLATRRALVVLDNCEHVLDAAGALVEALLARCAGVRMVVTSREGLGIPGEQAFVLRSLALPTGDDAGALNDSDSVRLFEDRARAVDPEFVVTAGNATLVAEICRRLDGIPLALELAAARVRVLSLAEIRDRLDDRFRLLTGGSRTALPRHQTLGATMQWSYGLLSGEEQRLFRLLSVFAGGCTLAAATHVAGERTDEFEMLDHLTRLTDKSLLNVARGTDDSTRYLMLETVRQFAQGCLDEAGEGRDARDRHLEFHLALAEEADAHIRGPHTGRWLAHLEPERENLLGAHVWCGLAPHGAQLGLRLQGALMSYWRNRGLLDLGLRLAEEALGRDGAAARTRPRALLLSRTSLLQVITGAYDRALLLAGEAVGIARELDDTKLLVLALLHMGGATAATGDYASAVECTQEAIPLAERLEDKISLSALLNNLGEFHRIRGDLDAAAAAYARALQCCRDIGRVEGIATHLVNQSYVSISRGRLAEANAQLRESLQLCREHGLRQFGLIVLELVMALAAASGDAAFAAQLWGTIDEGRRAMHARREPQDEAFTQEWLARTVAALGETAFAAASAGGRTRDRDEVLATALAWLQRS